MSLPHSAFYISNSVSKKNLIQKIKDGAVFKHIEEKQIEVFSEVTLNQFIAEEKRHGDFVVKKDALKQSLLKYSEGERKKTLLEFLLAKEPDVLILDNPYDNLDASSQLILKDRFETISNRIILIQIAHRKNEILDFIDAVYCLNNENWELLDTIESLNVDEPFVESIPKPYETMNIANEVLVDMRNVNVSFNGVAVLENISLQIKKHEFWQITGKNGAGKSTLLSLITGDSVKGYGQDITLFGIKKGSGESVWEHKRKIGYFSSDMKMGFARKTSLENMILSGFYDSIGLYDKPTKIQIEIMVQWLKLLGFYEMRKKNFIFLTAAEQRLVLIARAMIKHPPLLILDEPTAGLDDKSVHLLVSLINKIHNETKAAILYVSHKKEVGLHPLKNFNL
ncbi:MAG: hypothetical protein BM563_11025 [Bacteroidetes bacterium MedPE-SWsnd-G1]|nr:MAG: hypothetical protein BM563_11025 [Bacteroidetes bacterium MedPE-SWsnd-G1]